MKNLRSLVRHAHYVRPHGNSRTCRERPSQFARNKPQIANRCGQRLRRAGALDEHPYQNTERNEGQRDVGWSLGLILVVIGEHKLSGPDLSSLAGAPGSSALDFKVCFLRHQKQSPRI
jgi:hypothetical protein